MTGDTDLNAKIRVLIHGASHGGWCYDRVAELLRSQGHRVFAPTLPGLAERSADNARRRIDLTAHIDDILGMFEHEGIEDAILCGHSYGGMVISGVADRIPDRVRNLVIAGVASSARRENVSPPLTTFSAGPRPRRTPAPVEANDRPERQWPRQPHSTPELRQA